MKLSTVALEILKPGQEHVYHIQTKAAGGGGKLPMTADFLRNSPCGDVFGWIENVAQGWNPSDFGKKQFLILSMNGGIRAKDGTPIALTYSTGQFEPALLAEEAASEIKRLGAIPFASFVTEHCDGRMQSNSGMMDSLAYRNDAAIVLRRLIRCLPCRHGVLGIANCDKGLPAMMMALGAMKDLPSVLIPGGVTLPPIKGEDAGKVQSLPARFARGEVTLEYAQEVACTACASPGGSCQFLGTAATSQVVGEALGLSVLHSALAPSGQSIWLELARSSARALLALEQRGITVKDVLTDGAIRNAMIVHAAFGGSMNLLLHLPAIAHAAGLKRPTVDDWTAVNRQVPRLVDVLPNGPRNHPTVQVYLAGGVPEVMLRLRELDVLDLDALTVTGDRLGVLLEHWEHSERRARLRAILQEQDGVDPEDVIMTPSRARQAGLTGTVTFPRGNIAPAGSVIKSTAIDPSVVDADGVYRKRGPAKVFVRETDVLAAIKSGADSARRRDPPDLRRPHGQRHGRGLRGDRLAEASGVGQARGPDHRRPVQRRQYRRVHRSRGTGGPGGWADRKGPGRRHHRHCDRPQSAGRPGQSDRRGRRSTPVTGYRAGQSIACEASAPARSCCRCPVCRTTRGCGPCSNRPAAARGEDACTTSIRSPGFLPPV